MLQYSEPLLLGEIPFAKLELGYILPKACLLGETRF